MCKEQKKKLTKGDWVFASILIIAFASLITFLCFNTTFPAEDVTTSIDPYVIQSYSLEDSIETTIDNVVHIRNNSGQCQGSGVLLKPGLILTARHVGRGKDFEVKFNDGTVYKASRAITSKTYDLGFIKLDAEDDLPECTTQIGTIKNCRLGQTVYAIGSPYGDINQNSVTAGIVSSLARRLEDFDCPKAYGWSVTWQTDAAGHPGNSGCPVYTLDGKVVGILVGGCSNSLVYCIPAELVTNDCQVIELMFLMDKYQKEQEQSQPLDSYYNVKLDSEYY